MGRRKKKKLDPYKVLGVKPGDDQETIKKAYRELAKKIVLEDEVLQKVLV